MKPNQRILNILIAFDQFAFCIITIGGSYPDETLSSAAWRWEQEDKKVGHILRPLIDKLFFFQEDHCFKSYLAEALRKQAPRDSDDYVL